MHYLRLATATTVLLGPFLDETDAKTPETGILAAATDIDLYKGTTKTDITDTDSGGANDFVHVANGYYSLEVTAANTDTSGRITITVNATGALPLWHEFTVLPPNVYDSLVAGSDLLSASVGALGANSITAATIAADAGTELANAMLDQPNGVDPGFTVRDSLKLVASATTGLLDGAGTTNPKFKSLDGSKTRINAIVDSSGNRTSVVKDVS